MSYNPFAGTKDKKGYERTPEFPIGFVGAVKIQRCILYKTRERNTNIYIVDVEILESNMPAEHPVGAARAWKQDKDIDAGGPALQGFVCAVMGVNPKVQPEEARKIVSGVDEYLFESLCPVEHASAVDPDPKKPGPKAAFKGLSVRLTTRGTETTKAKARAAAEIASGAKDVKVKLFNVHDWTPFEAAA